jgi:hypothetical protein
MLSRTASATTASRGAPSTSTTTAVAVSTDRRTTFPEFLNTERGYYGGSVSDREVSLVESGTRVRLHVTVLPPRT